MAKAVIPQGNGDPCEYLDLLNVQDWINTDKTSACSCLRIKTTS